MPSKKLNVTKNYRLFHRSDENRSTALKKHKNLERSMREYGFLPSFPISCFRENGHLLVKDGQHRLAFAEALGLPVYWVEEESDYDVAKVNSTAIIWKVRDYAVKFANKGKKDYQDVLQFADIHGLPIGIAAAVLCGFGKFSNVKRAFNEGKYKATDRELADKVAGVYGPIVRLSPACRNVRFMEALIAVCRVDDFDAHRLVSNAERCREKLVSYSTREAYLSMIEEVYNFGRHKLVGIKVAAINVMRSRNPVEVQKNGKAPPVATSH